MRQNKRYGYIRDKVTPKRSPCMSPYDDICSANAIAKDTPVVVSPTVCSGSPLINFLFFFFFSKKQKGMNDAHIASKHNFAYQKSAFLDCVGR